MTSTQQSGPPIIRTLSTGAITGVASAVAANVYHAIQSSLSNTSYAELNLVSITMTALITSLIGSFVHLGLSRLGTRGTTIFTILGLSLAVLSSVPQLFQPLHPGFGAASVPLHLIVGVIAVALIPRLSRLRQV